MGVYSNESRSGRVGSITTCDDSLSARPARRCSRVRWSASAEVAATAVRGRPHLVAETLIVLGLSLGRSAVYSILKIIDRLTEMGAVNVLDRLSEYKLVHKSDRTYQLWQEGSHPKLIQGEEMMRQKIEYIHYNPVRRGYVDLPIHWRYSSARNYAGLDGLIPVTTRW